jgi:hypothetical protein
MAPLFIGLSLHASPSSALSAQRPRRRHDVLARARVDRQHEHEASGAARPLGRRRGCDRELCADIERRVHAYQSPVVPHALWDSKRVIRNAAPQWKRALRTGYDVQAAFRAVGSVHPPERTASRGNQDLHDKSPRTGAVAAKRRRAGERRQPAEPRAASLPNQHMWEHDVFQPHLKRAAACERRRERARRPQR